MNRNDPGTLMSFHPVRFPSAPEIIEDVIEKFIKAIIERCGSSTFVRHGAVEGHLRFEMIPRYSA
ncbi:MAG: hypothetical protein E4G96_04545 [Chrysiogenales bacterium]|nr:MAG: hypothetical protein E4G96_04545 [Chrysiogenales bacterium]